MAEGWQRLLDGEGCPFDAPRPDRNKYWDLVATLSVSSLYLDRNQAYYGYCLLIFDPRHAVRADQLTSDEWSAFCQDVRAAQTAIMREVAPDHINLAALGNAIPHLHWHIIPRYKSDPRWGKPVWVTSLREAPIREVEDDERSELIHRLRSRLATEEGSREAAT